MVNLVREAQESKKKIISSVIISIFSLMASLPLFIISDMGIVEGIARIIFIVIGVIVLFGGIFIACFIDNDAGAFECPECKTRFVPDMKAYILGPHTITKRKLVCPHCGAKKYCKKVLTK